MQERRLPLLLAAAALWTLTSPAAASLRIDVDSAASIVNQLTHRNQTLPDVIAPSRGEAIVAWQGPWSTTSRAGGLWSRRIRRSGQHDDEQLLNTGMTEYPAFYVDLAATPTGTIAAWQTIGAADGDHDAIFARALDDLGEPIGAGPFLVNQVTDEYQYYPNSAAGDGGYLVSWVDGVLAGTAQRLVVRLFDAGGNPITDEIEIDNGPYGFSDHAVAITSPENDFVVATTAGGVAAYYLDADGVERERLPFFGFGNAGPVGIGVCPDGRHLIAWSAYDNGPIVAGQWVDAGARPIGEPYVLADQGVPSAPKISVSATSSCRVLVSIGGAVIVTDPNEAESPPGSRAPLYYLPASSFAPKIAADSSETFVAVWTENVGPDADIAAQWLCLNDDAAATCGDATCSGDADAESPAERITVRDAVRALAAATGLTSCFACACDTDASGAVTSSDAARILRASVGQPVTLTCAACE